MNYQIKHQKSNHGVVVTAREMREIEERIFAAGMPVAALMEKVAGLIARRLQVELVNQTIGILVGPGHNGGDALVVARELHLHGYKVAIYSPCAPLKELTRGHLQYAQHLGIPCHQEISPVLDYDVFIDGLFGFGLERAISGVIASAVDSVNNTNQPIFSIDIPSGIHTDTGEVLGTAIRATHTFCLGLWKLGLFQDSALEYIGKAELIDFDIPEPHVKAVLAQAPSINRITAEMVVSTLPLPRPLATHKYREGHLLLICGSRRYAGGAILTALGARASGVGMLSVAVPESLKPVLVSHLPEALIIDCPETRTGAIAQLPGTINLNSFSAIACGPGLTLDAHSTVQTVLASDRPLILDADALNILANSPAIPTLANRRARLGNLTILTPHTAEFQRLFPQIQGDKITAVRQAAAQTGAIILLKGARTIIANEEGSIWVNSDSTAALARGGSGDVLTGVMGGILASGKSVPLEQMAAAAAWWHSQGGILAARERTELGVDAFTLTDYLVPVIRELLKNG